MFWIFIAVTCTVSWLLDQGYIGYAFSLMFAFGIFYLTDKALGDKNDLDQD